MRWIFLLFHKIAFGGSKRNSRSDQREEGAILAVLPQKQIKTFQLTTVK